MISTFLSSLEIIRIQFIIHSDIPYKKYASHIELIYPMGVRVTSYRDGDLTRIAQNGASSVDYHIIFK